MRFMTALVVALAVLIVAAAGLLAWGLFTGARAPRPPVPAASGAVLDLGLPEGCAIKSVTVLGGNLAIHAQGAGASDSPAPCDRVLIVDPAGGRVVRVLEGRSEAQGEPRVPRR